MIISKFPGAIFDVDTFTFENKIYSKNLFINSNDDVIYLASHLTNIKRKHLTFPFAYDIIKAYQLNCEPKLLQIDFEPKYKYDNLLSLLRNNNYNIKILKSDKDLLAYMTKIAYEIYNDNNCLQEHNYKLKNSLNYPLVKCLINYHENKHTLPSCIVGAGTMDRYYKDDSLVFIFSDKTHGYEQAPNNAMYMETFLQNWVNNSQYFLDIFIEMPYSGIAKVCHLTETYRRFKECFSRENKYNSKCPPNVRFHHIDFRPLISSRQDVNSLKEIKAIYDMTYIQFQNYNYKRIDENLNLQKQIAKCDPSIVSIIIDSCISHEYKYFEDSREIFLKLYDSLKKSFDDPHFDDICMQEIDKIDYLYYGQIFSVGEMINIDIYTMCRLFKRYDTTRNPWHPDYAKFSIIYAGSYHTKLYNNILKQLNYRIERYYYGTEPNTTKFIHTDPEDFYNSRY